MRCCAICGYIFCHHDSFTAATFTKWILSVYRHDNEMSLWRSLITKDYNHVADDITDCGPFLSSARSQCTPQLIIWDRAAPGRFYDCVGLYKRRWATWRCYWLLSKPYFCLHQLVNMTRADLAFQRRFGHGDKLLQFFGTTPDSATHVRVLAPRVSSLEVGKRGKMFRFLHRKQCNFEQCVKHVSDNFDGFEFACNPIQQQMSRSRAVVVDQ